ncbi:MAG: hypothetical protein KC731_07105 [Myxococcales bacterium]|nr:hypothetical protein [Myxococcales bacterium]
MKLRRIIVSLATSSLFACGSSSQEGTGGAGGQGDGGAQAGGQGGATFATGSGGTGTGAGKPDATQYPELWYAVDQLLVRIELDASDGSLVGFTASDLVGDFALGQNALTMLDDGSLLGARLSKDDLQTYFYLIADPPRDGSSVTPDKLGVMPDGLMIEGLYTDCEGRIYAMDTGSDDTNADGNRLLRFTGQVRAGDFSYVVVSDLATADVADIDDMSPGIVGGAISDNPGLAIDTGDIHAFDYQTGSGTFVANAGTYGIHALGGPLFDDAVARLYVLSSDAELLRVDPTTFVASGVLGTGPTPLNGIAGWSGLAGPLTDCETGFVPQ